MIDYTDLKLNDKFYGVKERNNSFHRKKIHRIIDGEDWFKYDTPIRTYEVVEYKILGILRKELEGQWMEDEQYELETQFCIRSLDETHMKNFTIMDNNWFENEHFFHHRSEAKEMIKILEEKAREMDMT